MKTIPLNLYKRPEPATLDFGPRWRAWTYGFSEIALLKAISLICYHLRRSRGMDDLRPATREELLHFLFYALRFDRRGKSTRRNSELMTQLAAEALADMLDQSGYLVMKKPGTLDAAETAGRNRNAGCDSP